ncbi:pilin [Thioflexithrix psekupsensis]|uniref:Pilus assembly protein PilA n=1 Tax=Thioflexithrix psekupsensis TaxID=1570016 RepID=A0A251X8H3_9GAMM|nr:pilin [Thioflexithrix psekupsensis]OUD14225.1 hypothetical protein TPSD3_07805 [Thioflexithrix psekupsensis]
MIKFTRGFTLIELMIVIAIMAILSTIAMPTYQDAVIRTQISEGIKLAEPLQRHLELIYQQHQRFPADNHQAGLPQPQQLIGNYVTKMWVENGAIHITYGHRINAHVAGKTLTLRPATVMESPKSPLSWLCGYAQAVPGMQAQGHNLTDIPSLYLSPECRSWRNAS